MKELPLVFRLLAKPIAFLNTHGVGKMFGPCNSPADEQLRFQISAADLPLEVREVRCCQVATILFLLGFGLFLSMGVPEAKRSGAMVMAVFLGLFMGWMLPPSSIQSQAKNRQMDILRALPFAIDLLSAAMRAGLDFGASLRYFVGLGIRGPLTEEFGKMLRETELGVSRIDALLNMAHRLQIREFTSFASAIALGSEMGAPISHTMEIQGEEMRKVRFNIAEQKAQRAPSIMILPMVMFIMPAVFVIIITPVILKLQMAKGGM